MTRRRVERHTFAEFKKARSNLLVTKKSTPRSRSGGTVRWSPFCEKGDFLKVPKAALERLAHFSSENSDGTRLRFQPHHLWLLLVLQASLYQDRAPRFFWVELAAMCGKSTSTVRKWGYELEKMGLLTIRRRKNETTKANERNEFDVTEFVKKVDSEQRRWKATRQHGGKK